MIPAVKNLDYERRLKILGLWSREERRNRANILEVYKMYNGVSQCSSTICLKLVATIRQEGIT